MSTILYAKETRELWTVVYKWLGIHEWNARVQNEASKLIMILYNTVQRKRRCGEMARQLRRGLE